MFGVFLHQVYSAVRLHIDRAEPRQVRSLPILATELVFGHAAATPSNRVGAPSWFEVGPSTKRSTSGIQPIWWTTGNEPRDGGKEVMSRESIDHARTEGLRFGGKLRMLTLKHVTEAQDNQREFPLMPQPTVLQANAFAPLGIDNRSRRGCFQ